MYGRGGGCGGGDCHTLYGVVLGLMLMVVVPVLIADVGSLRVYSHIQPMSGTTRSGVVWYGDGVDV